MDHFNGSDADVMGVSHNISGSNTVSQRGFCGSHICAGDPSSAGRIKDPINTKDMGDIEY